MPDYNWTPAALYELVKGLPEEARPEDLEYCNGGWLNGPRLSYRTPDEAVLMYEASVLRWLVEQGWCPIIEEYRGKWMLANGALLENLQTEFTGPTLLHALVAAAEAFATP